jgi:hypothetical protein
MPSATAVAAQSEIFGPDLTPASDQAIDQGSTDHSLGFLNLDVQPSVIHSFTTNGSVTYSSP